MQKRQEVEERGPTLRQSQEVDPEQMYPCSYERLRVEWAACLCSWPVLGAQGLSSHQPPGLEAFKISWDEFRGKTASQEICSVVIKEQSFILNKKFAPLSWKKISYNSRSSERNEIMLLRKVQNLTRRSNAEHCQNFLIKLKKCWQVFQVSFAQDNNVLLGFFENCWLDHCWESKSWLVKIFILSYESKGKADTSGNSAVLKLAKGDEVWLRMGNGALHGDHQRFSTFAGFLLFETK